MTDEEARAYLAAMIDGEGSIADGRTKSIRIANTERSIIDAVIGAYCQLGFEPRLSINKVRQTTSHGYPALDCMMVHIHGLDQLQSVKETFPLQSNAKKAKLNSAIASYKKRPYTRNRRRPSKEQYINAFKIEKLTHREIAKKLGLSSHSQVQADLAHYNLY